MFVPINYKLIICLAFLFSFSVDKKAGRSVCRVRNKFISEKLADFASQAHNHPIGVLLCFCKFQIQKTHKFLYEIYKYLGYKLSASHGTASFFMKLRTLSQNKKTLSSIFLFENLKKCKNFYINQIVRIKIQVRANLLCPRNRPTLQVFGGYLFVYLYFA